MRTKLMKKALGETQTLRAGAEPKKIRPAADSDPGAQDSQSAGNGHYLHLETNFGENRCTQFRVFVVTDPGFELDRNAPERRSGSFF